MNRKHFMTPIGLTVIILSLLIMASFPAVGGTFKDRDGGMHTWSVGSAHQLLWDNKPYVPFGVVFQPKSLAPGAGDAEFEADKTAITSLKNAGVTDVLIEPGNGGLTASTPKSFQRIVDLLESSGMDYGIEIYDAPYAPLTGYVINPVANRVDGIKASGEVTHKLADSTNSIWALCDTRSHEVNKIGHSALTGDNISVNVSLHSGEEKILLFFPQKSISSTNPAWGLPDLWTEFGSHRDRLISFLSQVRFGKGLRYFIDPFSEQFGINGETENLIPTSPAFRLAYAAWLSREYDTPGSVGAAWALGNHELNSFSDAARLIPLWKDTRGVPYVYDDATGKGFPVEVNVSAIWADFLAFRTESISEYMNAMADVIKRTVADVPVIYTANGLKRIYESASTAGYDGLVSHLAVGRTESAHSNGLDLSMAKATPKPTWLISMLGPSSDKFASKEDMFSLINDAHDLGSKGFVFKFGAGEVPGTDVAAWLKEYSDLGSKDKYFTSYMPNTIFYPQGIVHTEFKQFKDGTWWLPALTSGSNLYLGPDLAGYAAAGPDGQSADIYIWSLKGKQTVHFDSKTTVSVTQASGDTKEIKPRKDRVEITISEEPEIIRGIPVAQFIPVEVVEQALADLENSINAASKSLGDVSVFKFQLDRAKDMYKKNLLATSLEMVRVANAQLKEMLAISKTAPQRSHVPVPGE